MEMDPTYPEKLREQLRRLLLDYSFEQIMEIGGVEEIDALEYLVACGAIDVADIIESTDDRK